jgi:hypothetical protein
MANVERVVDDGSCWAAPLLLCLVLLCALPRKISILSWEERFLSVWPALFRHRSGMVLLEIILHGY